MSPSGTTGLGSTTQIRTCGFSPRVFFARWRKNARTRSNCTRKMAKTDGANPSVASLDICGSAMFPSGTTTPRLFGPVVSPSGSTRLREQDASSNPGFLASGAPYSLAETRKKPPSLHPKRVQHRRCQPVSSLVGQVGLQCPPLGTPVLGTLGLYCPP